MSETPRTDAFLSEKSVELWEPGGDQVWISHARQLERELAARTAERDSLREAVKRRDGVIEWLLEFYDEPDWKRGEVAKRLQEGAK